MAVLKVLITQSDAWLIEDARNKKPTVLIDLPGTPISDPHAYKQKITELYNGDKTIGKRRAHHGCSKCRWTLDTKIGCAECNPSKHEVLIREKLQETTKLKNALAAALEAMGKPGNWKIAPTIDLRGGGDGTP